MCIERFIAKEYSSIGLYRIPVVPHEPGKHLVACIGLDLAQLVQASGGSEIFMVAGGLLRTRVRNQRESIVNGTRHLSGRSIFLMIF